MNKTITITSLLAVGLTTGACDPGDEGRLDDGFSMPAGGVDGDMDVEDEDEDEPEDDGDEPAAEDPPDPLDYSDVVDEFILDIGHMQIAAAESEHEVGCNPANMDCPDPWNDGELTCELQYYEQTQHFDTFVAIQPDSPALWPGAVLRGSEVHDGFLSQIGAERAPATLSLSLENLVAAPSATMDSPSLSAFRDARNAILAEGLQGATPANIAYEIHTVESAAQLSIMVGVSIDWASVVDFGAMFGFEDSEFNNKYLFEFTQTYYTVDLDTPARPSDFFDDSVTPQDLQPHMGPGQPPVYVQSVSYGRKVWFAMESNSSLEQIVAAIDVAVSGVAALEADLLAQEVLAGSKITAAVIGGDGDDAAATVLGVEELMAYITEGGNYSADSPGAPIAYKTAYLDNVPMRMALTAQYPMTECQ